jgi:hypothetical protein
MTLAPRRLYYQEARRGYVAMNGPAENLGLNIDRDDFMRESRCKDTDVVWVCVRSDSMIVDWGIADYASEPELDPGQNGELNAAFVPVLFASAGEAGFSRRRYVRTGLAGSMECFPCEARMVSSLRAMVVTVDARGWDPEIGTVIAKLGPQRASVAVYDRYPNDENWVRSFDLAGDPEADPTGYRSWIGDGSTVLVGCPPRFARFMHWTSSRTAWSETTGALTLQIHSVVGGTLLFSDYVSEWAGPVPPWCSVTIVGVTGSTTAGLVTWSVRPMLKAQFTRSLTVTIP